MAKRFALVAVVAGLVAAIFSPALAASETSIPKMYHVNGSVLLAKLARDDTYAVAEIAHHMVIAKLQNGKVVHMEADGLPMRRIKITASTRDALQQAIASKTTASSRASGTLHRM